MKFFARFKFFDRVIKKKEERIESNLLIKGRAQAMYLSGPYPHRLSHKFGKGTLWKQIDIQSQKVLYGVIGKLSIGQMAWYAKVWESIDQYAHRKGRVFKCGHPMSRPFARPAYEDMKLKIKRVIGEQIVKG
jgi:hypothetical protein